MVIIKGNDLVIDNKKMMGDSEKHILILNDEDIFIGGENLLKLKGITVDALLIPKKFKSQIESGRLVKNIEHLFYILQSLVSNGKTHYY